MTMERNRTGGLILAAGLSSRMGRFKPLLDFEGEPVLSHMVKRMRRAGIGQIAVVTGHNREQLAPVLASLEVQEVYNPRYREEMFTSVLAGVDHFARDPACEGVFLTPVDCPAILPEDYIRTGEAARDRCACACYMGKKGHPLYMPRRVFDPIRRFAGPGGLKNALAGEKILRAESENEGVLMDMDTPEGYEKLLAFSRMGYHFPTAAEALRGRRLLLVRHGQIRQHREKIFLGQYDPPLSELGQMQAAEAAQRLCRMPLQAAAIFSSPLERTLQTAQRVSEALSLPVTEIPELREISLGRWDGRPIREIREEEPEAFARRGADPLYFAPPGGENMVRLRYRVLEALREIARRSGEKDLILVTHAGVINTVKCLLGQGDFTKILEMEKPAPGSVTVLEV
jgi:broad specificity phosphatase PhoE/CTP:molybdopterin cytidylyltransferase MocA